MASGRQPPLLESLLGPVLQKAKKKPVAFVLAGHNGSGKSTLWYERLSPTLRIPLINADRLTASILPDPLPPWAIDLRDRDERWQLLSQQGVRAFFNLVRDHRMPFAFETVFSYLKPLGAGKFETKAELIIELQAVGYFVVLIFVGLASTELSILRVQTRMQQGGHAVPLNKLQERFPRTQQAICLASTIADMTIMLDNSRAADKAFTLARAQQGTRVLFDCRDPGYAVENSFKQVATLWLSKVASTQITSSRRRKSTSARRRT